MKLPITKIRQNRRQEFEEEENPKECGLDFMLHTMNYDLHYLSPEMNGWKFSTGINLTMLCDFYELTMGNGYLADGMEDRITYFDIFYRSIPDKGGYAIAAGLEQIVDYVQKLHFSEEDIRYLEGRKLFKPEFLEYLRNFRFTGDIWAVPEGMPIFPGEPVITVRAPAIQAQLPVGVHFQEVIVDTDNAVGMCLTRQPYSSGKYVQLCGQPFAVTLHPLRIVTAVVRHIERRVAAHLLQFLSRKAER